MLYLLGNAIRKGAKFELGPFYLKYFQRDH